MGTFTQVNFAYRCSGYRRFCLYFFRNPKIALGSRNTSKMSAALFGSIACAVQRTSLARPVAALVTASSPRRAMSDKGNQDGTVGSAGDSFKKREKAEEARYFNKLQSEQLEKLHKKHEKEEKEKAKKKKDD